MKETRTTTRRRWLTWRGIVVKKRRWRWYYCSSRHRARLGVVLKSVPGPLGIPLVGCFLSGPYTCSDSHCLLPNSLQLHSRRRFFQVPEYKLTHTHYISSADSHWGVRTSSKSDRCRIGRVKFAIISRRERSESNVGSQICALTNTTAIRRNAAQRAFRRAQQKS